MSPPRVVFDSVWKKFRRGERHDSLRDLIPSAVKTVLGRRTRAEDLADQEFWALRDVSFAVEPGQALGIIGPNGAGKSTTLKILTKILKPSRGRCEIRGRVGALIEIAAGFHPDLTGRENVFLQGAIMGMTRNDVAKTFDDIVEFANIGGFIDTPTKRYSSGMNARLGFAIAVHLHPDVLLIDEVLSVGDMAFQERCIERMRRFKRDGVAIVFVSHNLQAVAQLCEHAVYLRQTAQAAGLTAPVIDAYIQDGAARQTSDSREVTIEQAVLMQNGTPAAVCISPGALLTLRVRYNFREPMDNLTFGFIVYRSHDRLLVYDGNLSRSDLGTTGAAVGKFDINFDFRANLTRGHYFLECHVFHNPTQRFLSWLRPAAAFTVHETATHGGVADLAVHARVDTGPQFNVDTPAADAYELVETVGGR
jgi:lipopolysaccharide transport system ATP-binding protein